MRNKKNGLCNKYYETFAKGKWTNGIMVFMCPHGYYIGYHFFESSEGLNDVFSVLYTRSVHTENVNITEIDILKFFGRWKVAPKVVLYDFACGLAEYCNLREPKFFENTLFLVDDFHSKGHVGCSKAAHLKHYRRVPGLNLLNSSLVESANKVMGKIANQVAYMKESRANILIHSFVCTQNRKQKVAHFENCNE